MRNTSTMAKWITGAALAAALLVATPNKAQAQVGFQVDINRGGYGYNAPVYNAYGPGEYRDWHHDRWIEQQREASWRDHQWQREQWERARWHRDHWGHRDGYRDFGGPRY